MIKRIELNALEREQIRNLLFASIYETQEELRQNGFSTTGITKATDDLVRAGKILNKLSFEVFTPNAEI